MSKTRFENIVFVIITLCLLFVPLLHIENNDKSDVENRMLAARPRLFNDESFNQRFGENFNDWLADRFFARRYLLDMYFKIYPAKENDLALEGKNGWLFYKQDNSIRNYQNLDLFNQKQLNKIIGNLVGINDWCKKNGLEFSYFIAPDKNKIYGENFRKYPKINNDEYSRARQLVKAAGKRGINVLYAYDELMAQKSRGLLYYKNDTHWNMLGAWYGYLEIMGMLGDNLGIVPVKVQKWEETTNQAGDLTRMLPGVGSDAVTRYLTPVFSGEDYKCDSCPEEISGRCCKNIHGKGRAVIFHDSFTTALMPYFNRTFESVTYIKRSTILPTELEYIRKNCDIVILEQVERYLPTLAKYSFHE